MVFVTGDVKGNGNPTIYGSLISSGSANVTGNPMIIYDPNVLGRPSNAGQRGQVARHLA